MLWGMGQRAQASSVVTPGDHAAAGQAIIPGAHAALIVPCLPQHAQISGQWGGHTPASQR